MSLTNDKPAVVFALMLISACGLPGQARSDSASNHHSLRDEATFPDGFLHDFGKLPKGVQAKCVFRIVNTSDKPLRIHGVRNAMGCLRSSVTKSVIEPKQTGKLEVEIDTRRFSGSKTLGVWLDMDDRRDTIRFTIKAESQEDPPQ